MCGSVYSICGHAALASGHGPVHFQVPLLGDPGESIWPQNTLQSSVLLSRAIGTSFWTLYRYAVPLQMNQGASLRKLCLNSKMLYINY